MSASATDVGDRAIADLGLDDLDAEALDVAAVASVAVDQGVDDPHPGALADQLVSDVGADETEPAGDHADGGRQVGARGHPMMLEIPRMQRSVTWMMTSTNEWSPPASATGGTARPERCSNAGLATSPAGR